MKLFRLTRMKYADTLSGYGASLYGNRWNSKGTEVLYVAESRALAMAEVIVHITLDNLPSDYMMIEIEIPKSVAITILNIDMLDSSWDEHPFTYSTQLIGDDFIREGSHCILKVPSAVVKGDFNYLINTNHKDFKKIKITDKTNFPFDSRVFN